MRSLARAFVLGFLDRVSTRSDDGNTWTTFSSRVSRSTSSSQATAVRTRVSSVADSRSNALLLVLAEDLAGRGHHLSAESASCGPGCAVLSEDAVDLLAGEPRARGHPELAFHVVSGAHRAAHSAPMLTVPSGPACFLKIVLQRAGDVGMDHQSHIRFVDAHAEGVGRRDRA